MSKPLGGTDIERVTADGRDTYWTQVEINSNHYVIVYRPPAAVEKPITESIFADVWATPDGTEETLPDHPSNLGSNFHNDSHERITNQTMRKEAFRVRDIEFATFVSQALNEAVCTLEDKQDEEQQHADDVLAALRANKETHGGIDHELGR